MLPGLVSPEGIEESLEIFRCHLPVTVRNGQYFVARELYAACFMAIDVACLSGDNSFVSLEERVDNCNVCLSAASEEENICLRGSASFADAVFGACVIFVLAVARQLLKVYIYQALQDPGVRALVVIAFK